jgi:cobalt/nickel transport system permease protein
MVVVVAWSAHVGPLRPARGAFVAVPFMMAALPVLFAPGPALVAFALGPLDVVVSTNGATTLGTIALKSWISVQAALLLTYSTPFHDLVDGLRALRLPRIIVAIISFMYRYLGVLAEEAGRMMRARSARSATAVGRRAGASVRWRAAVTGSMVGSLFLRSYERSERIYAAMQARGFDGELRYLPSPAPSARAMAGMLLAVAFLVVFVIVSHARGPLP